MPDFLSGSSEVLANTHLAGFQNFPEIAALDDGGYVVVWQSLGQDGSGWGVFAQRFDSSGAKVGPEFQVNTLTTGDQRDPIVRAEPGGGFTIAWTTEGGTFATGRAQTFDAAGAPVGEERFLSGTELDFLRTIPLSDGGYLRLSQEGTLPYIQRFDAAGEAVGAAIRVSPPAAERTSYAYRDAAELAGGGFVVTYITASSASFNLFAQVFDADGTKLGAPVEIGRLAPSGQVVGLDDGGFLVLTYRTGVDRVDVFGHRFDATSAPVGDPILLNAGIEGDQRDPVVTPLAGGGFAVAWQSNGEIVTRVFTSAEPIFGTDGNDVLHGTPSDDLIEGLGGNDALHDGPGNDVLVGGQGDDWYYVSDLTFLIEERPNEGWDNIWTSISMTAPANVENIYLAGDAAIDATGNELANFLRGNEADNVLLGLEGNDILHGLGGDDVLEGGGGDNVLVGGAGRDTFVQGRRVVEGQRTVVSDFTWGEDTVLLTTFNPQGGYFTLMQVGQDAVFTTYNGLVLVLENTEAATLVRGVDYDSYYLPQLIQGTSAGEVLTGTTGADLIRGGGGNDQLFGVGGDDVLEGGEGHDWYIVTAPGGSIIERPNEGNDNILASISVTAPDNVENIYLRGEGHINATGNALSNQLRGNDASNILKGMAGNDALVGEGGDDTLIGGAGADQFIFGPGFGRDLVTDFGDGADTLHFNKALFALGDGATHADYVAAVMALASDASGSTVIDFGEDEVTLSGVSLASLQADEFGFF